jgi:hypothetical protein
MVNVGRVGDRGRRKNVEYRSKEIEDRIFVALQQILPQKHRGTEIKICEFSVSVASNNHAVIKRSFLLCLGAFVAKLICKIFSREDGET